MSAPDPSAAAPSPGEPSRGRRGGLLRSTAVFSAMTLLSRIAGFARDMLQATLFGTGGAMSAFIVAYRVPNFLRRVFAEGSMAMAFVPVLNEIRERDDRAALKSFIDHMAGALCAVVLVVCAIGMLAAPLIARLFAPGWADQPELLQQTAQMLRITFPYLLFISMMSLAASILNSTGRFGLPAFTPVLHNLTMIAAMLWLAPRFEVPPVGLAWGVLAAGVLQLALLWPSLGRLGLRPRLRPGFGHPEVRKVGRLMLPTLFSSSVAQVNLIVGTAFASVLAAGSVDWLYYSDRLIEFPLGLFGVALGTVILPHLSRRHAAEDAAGYNGALDWGLRMALLAGVPAGLGLLLLAEPITATVYNYGQFSAFDTRMAAVSLSAMSLGVPAFMLTKVLAPAFYARQDTRTPMRAAIWTVVANIVLTAAITTPLWLGRVDGAHGGIALATALAGGLNALLLWRSLRRSGLYRPEPGWGGFLLRLVAACVAMAVVVLVLRHGIGAWTAIDGAVARVGWLVLTIGAGAGCYGLVLVMLGLRPRHLRH
ncbi:murein biosynthesis integral membrane protein MurJ [Luteimonas yindakuii]|uniref:Probable lipid II flippase MurJ n=1 Tax=Luteimonas yindakuii TaxID=2565782 RepID=A0A4Z1RIX0_9GAMM|nr:murein biosynthesis integral membrane protein MurJ [Luteimonas yindakuii]TKS53591.1 murein biosynthesis integral membrane protein MurJ [Luteimonas yindakuii]